jgi:hypothetical protein
MTLLPTDEFEEMIVKVAKLIREEREQGRLHDQVVAEGKLIRLPMQGRAIFVGDIHGELESVDEILARTEFTVDASSSRARKYIIFLGDLVDRGPNSIEVLTTLFALKIKLGANVILLRGNHELPDVNSRYGFIDEVRKKYQRHGDEVYKLCNRLFERFPHAVMTANGIFAAHGGIPENVSTLEQVADMDGNRLEQLLWNDPRPEIDGFEQNYERDPMGITSIKCFGDNVTKKFLKSIGAKILVRGHEYFGGSGYMAVSRRVLSIFSAKYGRPDWRRAYIDTDLSKEIEDVDSLIPDIRVF